MFHVSYATVSSKCVSCSNGPELGTKTLKLTLLTPTDGAVMTHRMLSFAGISNFLNNYISLFVFLYISG